MLPVLQSYTQYNLRDVFGPEKESIHRAKQAIARHGSRRHAIIQKVMRAHHVEWQ